MGLELLLQHGEAKAPAPLYIITINEEHVTPHLGEFQHPKEQVFEHVFSYLEPLRGHTEIDAPFRGQFQIGVTTYRFHAYTLSNGDIRVGTIYVP